MLSRLRPVLPAVVHSQPLAGILGAHSGLSGYRGHRVIPKRSRYDRI